MLYRVRIVLEGINTKPDGEIIPYTDKTLDSVDVRQFKSREKANCLFESVVDIVEYAKLGGL